MWDDEHLFFAHISSPRTVANIRRGSLVEVNVVDPFARKGYRFKGPAAVHERGTDVCSEGIERLREAGSRLLDRVEAIVVVEVRQAEALVSPAYDDRTATEAEMIRAFQARFARLHGGPRVGRQEPRAQAAQANSEAEKPALPSYWMPNALILERVAREIVNSEPTG